jgi:hypothetical protein
MKIDVKQTLDNARKNFLLFEPTSLITKTYKQLINVKKSNFNLERAISGSRNSLTLLSRGASVNHGEKSAYTFASRLGST